MSAVTWPLLAAQDWAQLGATDAHPVMCKQASSAITLFWGGLGVAWEWPGGRVVRGRLRLARPGCKRDRFPHASRSPCPHGPDLRGQIRRQDRRGFLGAEDDRMAGAGTLPGSQDRATKYAFDDPKGVDRPKDFRTREQGLFSVPYAESSGTGPIAENGAFELRDGRRKPLADLQKAL